MVADQAGKRDRHRAIDAKIAAAVVREIARTVTNINEDEDAEDAADEDAKPKSKRARTDTQGWENAFDCLTEGKSKCNKCSIWNPSG
jgi:hypothetical protein